MDKIPSPYGTFAPLVASWRLLLVALWIGTGAAIQSLVHLFHLPGRYTLPVLFHKIMTRWVLGIRVEQVGDVSQEKPTLFLANHMSYLDILTMNSVIAASFISKAEIEHWPLFGFLAKLQDTVFVERRAVRALEQSGDLEKYFAARRNLILFPEGTSTDSATILPFKSSLLQAVYNNPALDVTIQPVSVACYGTNAQEKLYPWVGDMTLSPHLWNILQARGLHVRVTLHPPFKASTLKDRKALALYAHQCVESGAHGVLPLLEDKSRVK